MKTILSFLVVLVAGSVFAGTIRRHPDAYVIIEGERIPESVVQTMFPAYSVPYADRGCISFTYTTGALTWSTGKNEHREAITLPILDQMIGAKDQIVLYRNEIARVDALPEKYKTKVNGAWVEKSDGEKALADAAELDNSADTTKWTGLDKARFNVLLDLINELRLTNGLATIKAAEAKALVKEELKK